jgi:hypothetical protein
MSNGTERGQYRLLGVDGLGEGNVGSIHHGWNLAAHALRRRRCRLELEPMEILAKADLPTA